MSYLGLLWQNTTSKSNLERKGFLLLTCPVTFPALRKARQGKQGSNLEAGAAAEAMEEAAY